MYPKIWDYTCNIFDYCSNFSSQPIIKKLKIARNSNKIVSFYLNEEPKTSSFGNSQYSVGASIKRGVAASTTLYHKNSAGIHKDIAFSKEENKQCLFNNKGNTIFFMKQDENLVSRNLFESYLKNSDKIKYVNLYGMSANKRIIHNLLKKSKLYRLNENFKYNDLNKLKFGSNLFFDKFRTDVNLKGYLKSFDGISIDIGDHFSTLTYKKFIFEQRYFFQIRKIYNEFSGKNTHIFEFLKNFCKHIISPNEMDFSFPINSLINSSNISVDLNNRAYDKFKEIHDHMNAEDQLTSDTSIGTSDSFPTVGGDTYLKRLRLRINQISNLIPLSEDLVQKEEDIDIDFLKKEQDEVDVATKRQGSIYVGQQEGEDNNKKKITEKKKKNKKKILLYEQQNLNYKNIFLLSFDKNLQSWGTHKLFVLNRENEDNLSSLSSNFSRNVKIHDEDVIESTQEKKLSGYPTRNTIIGHLLYKQKDFILETVKDNEQDKKNNLISLKWDGKKPSLMKQANYSKLLGISPWRLSKIKNTLISNKTHFWKKSTINNFISNAKIKNKHIFKSNKLPILNENQINLYKYLQNNFYNFFPYYKYLQNELNESLKTKQVKKKNSSILPVKLRIDTKNKGAIVGDDRKKRNQNLIKQNIIRLVYNSIKTRLSSQTPEIGGEQDVLPLCFFNYQGLFQLGFIPTSKELYSNRDTDRLSFASNSTSSTEVNLCAKREKTSIVYGNENIYQLILNNENDQIKLINDKIKIFSNNDDQKSKCKAKNHSSLNEIKSKVPTVTSKEINIPLTILISNLNRLIHKNSIDFIFTSTHLYASIFYLKYYWVYLYKHFYPNPHFLQSLNYLKSVDISQNNDIFSNTPVHSEQYNILGSVWKANEINKYNKDINSVQFLNSWYKQLNFFSSYVVPLLITEKKILSSNLYVHFFKLRYYSKITNIIKNVQQSQFMSVNDNVHKSLGIHSTFAGINTEQNSFLSLKPENLGLTTVEHLHFIKTGGNTKKLIHSFLYNKKAQKINFKLDNMIANKKTIKDKNIILNIESNKLIKLHTDIILYNTLNLLNLTF